MASMRTRFWMPRRAPACAWPRKSWVNSEHQPCRPDVGRHGCVAGSLVLWLRGSRRLTGDAVTAGAVRELVGLRRHLQIWIAGSNADRLRTRLPAALVQPGHVRALAAEGGGAGMLLGQSHRMPRLADLVPDRHALGALLHLLGRSGL